MYLLRTLPTVVLTLAEDGIQAMTCFVRPLGPELFSAFGLPESLT
jgi:hypothetical protein